MTREEAIQIIRDIYHTDEEMKALESLIPELRESEDEKTRTLLVALVQWAKTFSQSGLLPNVANKMLSYLEKQKEIPMPNSTELIEMWDNEKQMLKEKDFRGDEWRLAYNAFMGGFARGTCVKFEKQKEQKPAWGEEDEKKIHFLSRLIEFQVKDGEYCFGEGACAISKQDAIEMLQSLRPHPKQEWSEEDDATIKSAVHWLEKYLSTIRAKDVSSATQDGILTVKTTITNLKSLPSSWKPSDEQMKALEECGECKRCIKELREQLKKL